MSRQWRDAVDRVLCRHVVCRGVSDSDDRYHLPYRPLWTNIALCSPATAWRDIAFSDASTDTEKDAKYNFLIGDNWQSRFYGEWARVVRRARRRLGVEGSSYVSPRDILAALGDAIPRRSRVVIERSLALDARFSHVRILDWVSRREDGSEGWHVGAVLRNLRLLRLLPGSSGMRMSNWLGVLDPTVDVVRFVPFSSQDGERWAYAGMARRLVINILYDEVSAVQGCHYPPCVSLEFKTANFKNVYIVLTPNPGSPHPHSPPNPPQVDEAPHQRMLNALAFQLASRWFWPVDLRRYIRPNNSRRLVIVGAETWDHEWLANTCMVDLSWAGTPATVLTEPGPRSSDPDAATLAESGRCSSDMRKRFAWWLRAVADLHFGEDDLACADKLLSQVRFITVDKFEAYIDDDEMFPLIMSMNPYKEKG
jgi:hypothetical protein